MRQELDLTSFVTAVDARAREVVRAAELHDDQTIQLLAEFPDDPTRRVLSRQMAPFYLFVRAHGGRVDAHTVDIGAAFALVQRAVSLVDQVEDDDLMGNAAQLGAIVTVNSGIAMFLLGIDVLWALEQTGVGGTRRLRAGLHHHAMRMARGQHREIVARHCLLPLDERIEIAGEKGSEFGLLLEYAAIAASATRDRDAMDPANYRAIGQDLALMVQVVNDVADVLGDRESDDLRTGTWNIPLTAMLETMAIEERADWIERVRLGRLPDRPTLANHLYGSGAMLTAARLVEDARVRFHRAMAASVGDGPFTSMLLAWVDDLARVLYRPRALDLAREIGDMDPSVLSLGDRNLFDALRDARAEATTKGHR